MGHYLSEDFLSQYNGIQSKNKGKLFDIIRLGRYSRRPETWSQLCKRVVEYSLSLYQGPANEQEMVAEAELMFDLMFHCIAFPSGRTMRIGGTEASVKYPESNFNCCFTTVECFEDICDIFHLSMCSCGVGSSIFITDVKKLPKLHTNFVLEHKEYETKYPDVKIEDTETNVLGWTGNQFIFEIVVGDSKQGWVQTLRSMFNILTSYDNARIIFNYNLVRPSGTPLKTWGGYAAGHEGLKFMFDKIAIIVKNCEGKLRPIDVLDINTSIASNVVVGGSRRAAEIHLFDPEDELSLNAKSKEDIGYWIDSITKEEVEYDQLRQINDEIEWKTGKNDNRTMSNNSITYTSKPSFDELRSIFERIKYNGEPGFFNLEAARKRRPNVVGLNPCITADTWVNDSRGPLQVKDLLNSQHWALVNGKTYKGTHFWETGVKPVFKLITKEGYEIRLTDNHKVLTTSGWKEAKELLSGDKIILNDCSKDVPWQGRGDFTEGWLLGSMVGDGCLQDNLGYVRYWGESQSEMAKRALSFVDFAVKHRSDLKVVESKANKYSQVACVGLKDLANKFGLEHGNKVNITLEIEKASRSFYLGYLQGLFDADGSVQGNTKKGRSIRLTQSSLELLKGVQRMLLRLGIKSTIYQKRHEAGYKELPNGKGGKSEYWCEATHELSISKSAMKIFSESVGFSEPSKVAALEFLLQSGNRNLYKSKYEAVFDHLETDGEEMVYDCTVDEIHRFDANGLIVHNCAEILLAPKGVCNLTTVNMMACFNKGKVDFELLEKATRLITRVGLRMTNVTLSLPKWDAVQKRDRLLGVSKTGEMDLLDALGWIRNSAAHIRLLESMNFWANDEADRYAHEMRVPRPLLVTCVKPEGTLSLLPTVSCGMHRSFAPYYLRRIRFADFDPMCKTLMELGVPWERDKTKKNSNRIVFNFPIKTESKIAAKDESLKDQFMGYIYHQKYYTDHNTSCTLLVGEDEWEEALNLTYEHWDDVIAVTFLKKEMKGTYIQPPYEQITEEQFLELNKQFPSSLDKIDELLAKYEGNIHDDTSMEESAECASGVCPAV